MLGENIPVGSWIPSNGTEGMWFTEKYCEHCIHEKFIHTNQEGDCKCEILTRSFLLWPTPIEEWIYDANGEPICTEHKKWDWGRDDDEGGLNEPPPKYPDDPNQLCLPFIFDELNIQSQKLLYE